MSSEFKHTPGPWHTVPYGDGDDTVICSDAAGNFRIAFMAVPGCRDQQERRKEFAEIKANARLIAASPELLEALRPFAAIAEHDISESEADEDLFRPVSKYNHAPLLTVGDFRRALAAIAKATGQ